MQINNNTKTDISISTDILPLILRLFKRLPSFHLEAKSLDLEVLSKSVSVPLENLGL